MGESADADLLREVIGFAAERRARFRSLRALAYVCAGPRALEACRLLAQAETGPNVLEPVSVALTPLAPLDRRAILASYGRLTTCRRN